MCILLRSAGRALLQFFLQLCGTQPTLEASLYGVQYFLVDMFSCFSIAGAPPRQSSQLIDLIVDHPNFILGCPLTNRSHSRGFAPRSYWGWAVTSPGKWPNHVPFGLWFWHGQTSNALWTGSVTKGVPTSDIHLGIHWHLDTSLPPWWRCPSSVLALWQMLSWLYDLCILDSVVHGN